LEENDMKKVFLIIVSSLIFFALTVNFSFAQGFGKKWGIGPRISYIMASENTVEGVNYKPDAAPLFEGNVTWFPINWFSLEFSAGYAKTDINGEVLGISLDFADFEQIPILLTGRFNWWNRSENLTLYGGGGIGYYVNDAKLSDFFSAALPGTKLSADDSIGFHFAGGVEWFLTSNWALNLDLKYTINKTDFTLTVPGFAPDPAEFDLNAFIGGIGIKYYFYF
jgi:outer membrane protein W